MSNPNIEILLPLVRKQFAAQPLTDVAQYAKERMNSIWYKVAMGDLSIETANDLESAISALRWEMGDRW